MAESTTIDLIVKNNIGDTTKDVEGLNSELSTTDETLKEIEKDSDKASKGVKKFGRKGSQEIDKLNKKIRKTKKEVSGLSDGVELGGQVMTEFGETLELVGVGGEELESVLGGVENVMKFSDGLEGIKKASTGFQKFSKGAVSGLSDVKKAIALTGIGLLVVALGTLVTYWDDISEYVSGISSELKDQLEVAEKQVELEQEKLDYIENQENVLKLQGKTEREILEYKQLQLKNVIDASKIALEKLQIIKKAEAEKNYDNLVMQKEYWEVQNVSLEIFLKGMDWVSELFGGAGGYAKQFKEEIIGLADVTKQFDSKEDFVEKMIGTDEDLKEGLKNLNKLENQYAGTQLALNKIDADRGKSRADRRKDILETEQDFQRQLFDIRVEGLKDTFATETAITMEDFKRRREDILANEKYTAEQKKALVEQLVNAETLALLEITKNYRDKAIQVQREITDERIANIKDESQRERAEINTKYTQLFEDLIANEEYTEQQKTELKKEYEIQREGELRQLTLKDNIKRLQDEKTYNDAMALQNEDNFNAMQLIKQEQALIERDIALQDDTLTANEKLLIEEEYQKKLRDIDDETQKHRQENRDRNMDLAKDGMKALSEIADFIAEKQSKSINKKYDNEKKKAKGNEKLLNQIEKNRIIALNKANKKAFQMKKASDLASAVMDGYRAVLSTYAQTPGGPIIKGIASGIAGAFSALQVAKIASSKFQGETFEPSEISASGGGGAGGTGGSIVSPEFNIVGDSGVNQLQDATPIQAYVVSGDVTTAQGLDRARIENATL